MLIAVRKATALVVNVGTSNTPIITVKDTLGARAIIINPHNASDGNTLTLAVSNSLNGTSAPAGGGPALTISGSPGDASSATGILHFITQSTLASSVPFLTDSILISGIKATAGGNVTFEVWLVFDVTNLLGQLDAANPILNGIMP